MEASPEKSQPSFIPKVKSILTRHSCSKEIKKNSNYQHPETSYILKYSPKYYKNLTLETSFYSPFLSKVKKIKKFKRFTGLFKGYLPQGLWFNLLASPRKEIEEIPQICSVKKSIKPSESSKKRLEQQKIRFFPNMTRALLSEWKVLYLEDDCENLLFIQEHFVRYVLGMRKLKNLKIKMFVNTDMYSKAAWILQKLDKMSRFLNRLEFFILEIKAEGVNVQDLFQNKNVLSHLTGLSLSGDFDPIFAEIPQRCKNLNGLSLDFPKSIDEKPEFQTLVTSIRSLAHLQSLNFVWSKHSIHLWHHFKPQPSLQHLMLEFGDSNFIREGPELEPGVVGHWDNINEVDVLELKVSWKSGEEMLFMKQFITMILKKVRRLRSLKIRIMSPRIPGFTYELFSVEGVPHLYESLERFEQIIVFGFGNAYSTFDLKILKPFRNLKRLNLGGAFVFSENIEDMVELLEANQKKGEYSELKINASQHNVRGILKRIEKVKRMDSNLQMKIKFVSQSRSLIGTLDRMCNDIQSVKPIKGLEICLDLDNFKDFAELPSEGLKEVLKKYSSLRNLVVWASNFEESLEYIKIDGEKVQMFINK